MFLFNILKILLMKVDIIPMYLFCSATDVQSDGIKDKVTTWSKVKNLEKQLMIAENLNGIVSGKSWL